MVQTAHFVADVGIPVFCCGFTSPTELVLGGGGGGSKSGVKNRLLLYKLDTLKRALDLKASFDVPAGEDAPMSLAVDPKAHKVICGINSSHDQLLKGKNHHLRVFSYASGTFTQDATAQALSADSAETYQKTVALSRSGPPLLAVGGSNGQLVLLSYPDLTVSGPATEFGTEADPDEVVDVDFDDSSDKVLAVANRKLHVFSTDTSAGIRLLQNIERPVFKKQRACTFRAARFGRRHTKGTLFTVVNSVAPGRASRKGAPRPAFLSAWDISTWSLKKTRTISQKPVTAFDISDDGALLGVASSDLSIAVLDANTLRPVLSILRAHDFPVTCLRFSPDGTLLVSGSADNTVRIIDVQNRPRASSPLWRTVLLALIVLLVAIMIQLVGSDEVLASMRRHLHL